ncbi:MAG: ATPase domain-containing protein [archaeon]
MQKKPIRKNHGDAHGNLEEIEKAEKALSAGSKIDLKVARALEELEAPFTAFVLTEPKEFSQIRAGIMRRFGLADSMCIYITFNTGFGKLESGFARENINTENIRFVDLISKTAGSRLEKKKNVSYLDGPSDLTELILLAEKLLNEAEQKKSFIILDSVSTMLVYNDSSTIEKFLHALLEKINGFGATAILLSSDLTGHEEITSTISQFVDKMVKI